MNAKLRAIFTEAILRAFSVDVITAPSVYVVKPKARIFNIQVMFSNNIIFSFL